MMTRLVFLLVIVACVTCLSCSRQQQDDSKLFVTLSSRETGIDFENDINDTKDFNIYTYRNFYNGGGVAIGDVNNDGLTDIYLTGNMVSNRLYLNKGNFHFEDVSSHAGIGGTRGWSTGVTMADVNGDGWLDIYVCNSGDVKGDDRQNELFINNGDGTFTERAQEYGLADMGYSTQASFFDYDKDGDLDVYVLNNSFRAIGSFNLKENERQKRDSLGGHKLYRNDKGKFTDVSAQAGIYGSIIAFGLGVLVSDLNRDGWPDVYVCNDFFERDYIYMNNRDGTFREELTKEMNSISMASMGVDAADINGDGFPEIFVTEMLPKNEDRIKTSMTFENWNKYHYNVQHDYYHQFTRNMLHLNNGIRDSGEITFSEIGRFSGVEATDWSWSALMVDLDNNGHKDIYVTNGIYRDILNQDYLRYISNDEVMKSLKTDDGIDYKKLIDIIPSKAVSNYAFSGGDDLSFRDSTQRWGLGQPSFSDGAAYGDLDNDGDLDLVVNNVNMPVFVYKNQTEKFFPRNHFLKVKLKGEGKNTQAIGALVKATCQDHVYYLEQMPVRGFESSVDHTLLLGLAASDTVDSLRVRWPSGKVTRMANVPVDQELVLEEKNADAADILLTSMGLGHSDNYLFQNDTALLPDDFRHHENSYSDFDKDPLIFQMSSTEGPRLAVADINSDGMDDVYIGGAKDDPGKIFIQQSPGHFSKMNVPAFEEDARCEDIDALFFDADGDHDPDLYVVSGGSEYGNSSSALSDRLYLNDGQGSFTKSRQLLPTLRFESTSCVAAADFDQDDDMDLFVGVRLKDRLYGIPQNGYILENDGKGTFRNVSDEKAPGLSKLGMITDACWADYNRDGKMDLVVVGEWMTIHLFENDGGFFHDVTEEAGLSGLSGWWNTIASADLDHDGDADFIAGNHGLNSRFHASKEKPVTCYVNDFDRNGSLEQIICTYNGDNSYPMVLLHDLIAQLPYLKKKYLKYDTYKDQRMQDIFTPEQLAGSVEHTVTTLESVALINEGGRFVVRKLPSEAQLSPVYAVYIADLDEDGHEDVLLVGNLFEVKPEAGRYDASYGTFLKGNGDGTFNFVPNNQCGLYLRGQVRDIVPVRIASRPFLMIARNNDKVQLLKINDTK